MLIITTLAFIDVIVTISILVVFLSLGDEDVSDFDEVDFGFNDWDGGGVDGLEILDEVPLQKCLLKIMQVLDQRVPVTYLQARYSHVHVTRLKCKACDKGAKLFDFDALAVKDVLSYFLDSFVHVGALFFIFSNFCLDFGCVLQYVLVKDLIELVLNHLVLWILVTGAGLVSIFISAIIVHLTASEWI
jgi:hypothetical protein